MLLRSTLATIHGERPLLEIAAVAMAMAKAQFRYYALKIWLEELYDTARNEFLTVDIALL